MTARASTVVITETEAVGGAHSIIAGQVIHTRYLTFPGRHRWGGSGGGRGDTKVEKKLRKFSAQALEKTRFLQCKVHGLANVLLLNAYL